MKERILIMGAAGRDFHIFNTKFRDNEKYEVVAFTATQIPYIDERLYPTQLSGNLYPNGIKIFPEEKLTELIKTLNVETVVFGYSDVSYKYIMNKSAEVEAAGANFMLVGPNDTMVKSTKPVISVTAVRTGCGKSQTARAVLKHLKEKGVSAVAIRHPMPYGDLAEQAVQRFATYEDFEKHKCTIEEREEYEPVVRDGFVIYAGVDYEKILRQAEQEADVILWDGGNNDFSFYKPDLNIVVVDPHRPGDELNYYPGEVNLRMADVIVINKMDSASTENILALKENILASNPNAKLIEANSDLIIDKPELIPGKNILVIEDGPTLTHGEMKIGAGTVAAQNHNVGKLIDPRAHATGEIKATFEKYPNIGVLLPAMGYSSQQIKDMEETINNTPDVDAVVIGTPIDLTKLITINKPTVVVRYELKEREGSIMLKDVLDGFLAN
ncbi:GTPase [Candidatus Woesearchaeota archaeon]|jgi:predicted GTPase|nr:GTPase [Candidatus Woesearchaeota archaeon]MBT5272243.1 GTPase [Candidatus Woesearchaeota archaeon]MBT6041164.1 GTPase [Candidatus Woesearchaeota archaeon]MBT6336515.1 GTPase [Candidatus Woesearchaeota archaeon]MBT7927405.1 GTPase [Candidatus Woesearchaeota archaeon]